MSCEHVFMLYQLVSGTGSSVVCGQLTVTTAGTTIYGNGKAANASRQEIYHAIVNDQVTGRDIMQQAMTKDGLLNDFTILCDAAQRYNFGSRIYQVSWNMDFSPQLIAIVRGEVLSISITSLGLTAVGLLVKLQSVIAALQVGMLAEASVMLGGITPDAFLTSDRLARYQSLVTSVDAILP